MNLVGAGSFYGPAFFVVRFHAKDADGLRKEAQSLFFVVFGEGARRAQSSWGWF